MLGAIRTQDILLHPFVTVRAFGAKVFFRAVFEGRNTTFLSLLQRDGVFEATTSTEPDLIERCVRLELQAAAIYRSLAERFVDSVPLSDFLNELVNEEQEHADLLRVCKSFACQGQFVSSRFSPWHASVPLPEQQMQEIVASLDKIGSVDDVVRVVMQIETSEINPIFLGVVEATESPFVKTLSPFRTAIRHHVDYICRSVTAFTASGAAASRELRAKSP